MGLTVLDAGVVIAVLDRDDPFHSSGIEALLESLSGGSTLLPGIAYAQTSVAIQRSDLPSEWFDAMLSKLQIQIGECTPPVLARGATMRASALADRRARQWHLPDALIVAEAIDAGADLIVTTDHGWPKLPGGPTVEVLKPATS